mgnify:CR=1 FL=1
MNIAVVGLGKIGLPLAVQFASRGNKVTGADINPATVELVNAGAEPFPGEAMLAETMHEQVTSGRLSATTETSAAVKDSDAVVLVVPLHVDDEGRPDYAWMDAATREVAIGLQPGTLVSYETTLPVGTTRDRYAPMLEEGSGLNAGEDFHLVFSPERVFTGRVFADLRKYPKLVGGINEESESAGIAFYESVLEFDERSDLDRPNGVWAMGSAEAAEMAKLAETTYRDVNIGLANQFAKFADKAGIDVHKVIEACNSQPYSHIHQPGIAVGGHCIPVYPRLYLSNDPDATIVRAARETNAGMPEYAVQRLAEEYGDLRGAKVVVLGASYRGGVKETAFSGVFPLVAALEARGAVVLVQDPFYSDDELRALDLLGYHRGEAVDVVILQADHPAYQSLRAEDLPGVAHVLDGRQALDRSRWSGCDFRRIGGGSRAGS